MEPARMEISERVPLSNRAPAVARGVIGRLGDLAPDEVQDMARLVVSELVTNIYRHAGLPPGDPIEVRIVLLQDTLRVEVAQRGSSFEAKVRKPPSDSLYGRGLLILDRVAHRWGTVPNGGLRVWAELALPASWRGVA